MRVRLARCYKLTSRTAFLFFAAVLSAIVVALIANHVRAQSCPVNPCLGDPCCGLVENCSVTSSSCQNAGWIWNFTNNTCSNPPTTPSTCDDMGMFWNFTSSTCQDNPATQITCEGVGGFWNSTSGTCQAPTPTPTPTPASCNPSTFIVTKCYMSGGEWDDALCQCISYTPVLIDVNGDGFSLTDYAGGVNFDFNQDGMAEHLSWTAVGDDDAWLVLDRNINGVVDNGKEMFGNVTFQSEPGSGVERNGFRALAEWDKPENGGNQDSAISPNDDVFSKLRLWQDANQNGVSDPGELHGLWEFRIERISLDYRDSRRRDQYGNEFRYRAKVYVKDGADLGRWAYDVFLLARQ